MPCKFGNRHKVGAAHTLAQASVKDNSARFQIFEMIRALRSFDSRECKSQKQNISDTRNNGRSAYSRCMRVSTKVQNQKIPSKARGPFLRRSHKKQLISSGNCCKTAVGRGKSGSSLKNQTAAFWRGGRQEMNNEQIPMSRTLEVKGGGRRFARRSITKISFFAVRIFNLTRSNDFVKGEIANIFSMRHFRYKVANFLNFFDNRSKI